MRKTPFVANLAYSKSLMLNYGLKCMYNRAEIV
jgi:hypothetical protein